MSQSRVVVVGKKELLDLDASGRNYGVSSVQCGISEAADLTSAQQTYTWIWTHAYLRGNASRPQNTPAFCHPSDLYAVHQHHRE